MEMNKIEVETLSNAVSTADELSVLELNELHLALVGGGGGDVVFA